MTEFWVYAYVRVEGRRADTRAVVHAGDCRACNHGQGRAHSAGAKRGLFRWHGPFDSLAAARAFAEGLTGHALPCARCRLF